LCQRLLKDVIPLSHVPETSRVRTVCKSTCVRVLLTLRQQLTERIHARSNLLSDPFTGGLVARSGRRRVYGAPSSASLGVRQRTVTVRCGSLRLARRSFPQSAQSSRDGRRHCGAWQAAPIRRARKRVFGGHCAGHALTQQMANLPAYPEYPESRVPVSSAPYRRVPPGDCAQ
jgi:hypothetical protein